MSFHILGRVVVILGSTKPTKDLLEKSGDIYSDRPVIPFFEMYAIRFGKSNVAADTAQDGCAMESTIVKIWRTLACSAQNCRTELSSCVPGSISCPAREESSCSRYSSAAESTGVDGTR
jgi:hypothetical protein